MPGELVGIALFIGFFWSISFITKTLSDNRVRRELMKTGANNEMIATLMMDASRDNPRESLKWGMVSVATGAALVMIQLLGLHSDEALTYGLIFLFAGSALIGFYLINPSTDDADV